MGETSETNNNQEEITLFDGNDLDQWKAFNKDEITKWTVEDGTIAFTPAEGKGEDLITKEEYRNFELSLEWKISEGGNSGIMWGVQEGEEWGVPYVTGPEIQVLDNGKHPDAKNGADRTANALYDMRPPSEDVTKPVGEWNEIILHIDYDGNEGWVKSNGVLVNEFPLQGEEWDAMIADSKFNGWDGFYANPMGHICLQDHGNDVWYRNIKIKEL